MAKQGDQGIVWCDETWNPTRGCSRVSEGCRNCYAEKVAKRFSGPGLPYEGLVDKHGRWNGKVVEVLSKLVDPIRWKRPRRIFVDSMSDLFHDEVDDVMIDRVFGVMAVAQHHTFQILTKRPERALRWFRDVDQDSVSSLGAHHADKAGIDDFMWDDRGPGAPNRRTWPGWPLPNVHIGVSVEDQETANERIPLLLQIPAAVRFLSCEPLLGPLTLTELPAAYADAEHPEPANRPLLRLDALRGGYWGLPPEKRPNTWNGSGDYGPDTGRVGWVIVGGESGDGARPLHPEWAKSLRDQCVAAKVPFLFKQWGEWAPFSQVPEDLVESTYRSRVTADEHEDQRALDESYGRDCTVGADRGRTAWGGSWMRRGPSTA